jgi:hypothetical protein
MLRSEWLLYITYGAVSEINDYKAISAHTLQLFLENLPGTHSLSMRHGNGNLVISNFNNLVRVFEVIILIMVGVY